MHTFAREITITQLGIVVGYDKNLWELTLGQMVKYFDKQFINYKWKNKFPELN